MEIKSAEEYILRKTSRVCALTHQQTKIATGNVSLYGHMEPRGNMVWYIEWILMIPSSD